MLHSSKADIWKICSFGPNVLELFILYSVVLTETCIFGDMNLGSIMKKLDIHPLLRFQETGPFYFKVHSPEIWNVSGHQILFPCENVWYMWEDMACLISQHYFRQSAYFSEWHIRQLSRGIQFCSSCFQFLFIGVIIWQTIPKYAVIL